MSKMNKQNEAGRAAAVANVLGNVAGVDVERAQVAGMTDSSTSSDNHSFECKNNTETPSRVSEAKKISVEDIETVRRSVYDTCTVNCHNGVCLRDGCLSRDDYERFCDFKGAISKELMSEPEVNALLSDSMIAQKAIAMRLIKEE